MPELTMRAEAYRVDLDGKQILSFEYLWEHRRVRELKSCSPIITEDKLRPAHEYREPNAVLIHVREILSVSIANLE